ncbi:hypothetical protein MIND_00690300 [Mycena indigotica]|uniref:F-box domain-containing protein n=1 Tax=Mycena indigotica TaxID=2126181 RepID=A0A8H6SNV4_9AGAR|nr:uncharacterized protein MIND_00690300 [Mycena indigotica]KAF7301255.1 hypothetical protein MIND_00690300 [Mycena indigotica]
MTMSRLNAARIPARGQHLFGSFFMLRDILLFIFEHCSPYDLVQLNASCRTFRGLIRDQPHLWDRAFYNMARGDSPALPPCPVIRSAGYSIPAYISWIFGGGPCSVRECEKFSNSLPFDFVWGFRACSPDCRDKLTSEEYLYYDWNCNFRSLGMFAHLPRTMVFYDGMTIDLYPKKAIITSGVSLARGTRPTRRPLQTPVTGQDRQRLDKNASGLKNWKVKYLVEKEAVTQANMKFILKQADENLEKAKELLQYKAVRAAVAVFSRDLQLLTECVWTLLGIPAELKASPGPIAVLPSKQRCGDCPDLDRLFTPEALESHQLRRHPHRIVQQPCVDCPSTSSSYTFTPIALGTHYLGNKLELPAQNLQRCGDCPSYRQRLFTPEALEAHQAIKHFHPAVKQLCNDCPASSRRFTQSALRLHREAKHPA